MAGITTPRIRQLARELSVDLFKIEGTGFQGTITEEDIKRAAQSAQVGQTNMSSTKPYFWRCSYCGYEDYERGGRCSSPFTRRDGKPAMCGHRMDRIYYPSEWQREAQAEKNNRRKTNTIKEKALRVQEILADAAEAKKDLPAELHAFIDSEAKKHIANLFSDQEEDIEI